MHAHEKTRKLMLNLNAQNIPATYTHAETLRRAQMTLHRWNEQECNGTIQRDEETGIPYNWTSGGHYGEPRRIGKASDREKSALKRIEAVCKELNINYYYQTDPRGCALYVSPETLTDSNYNRGVACCD